MCVLILVASSVWATEPVAELPPLAALTIDREGCTAAADFEPKLAARQGDVDVTVLKEPGRTTETFALADGTPVRFDQGGCAHYGMSAMFSVREAPTDAYAAALKLLGQLKPVSGELQLLTTLRAAKSLSEVGFFACGDASCNVAVTTEGNGTQLVVSYDFPL